MTYNYRLQLSVSAKFQKITIGDRHLRNINIPLVASVKLLANVTKEYTVFVLIRTLIEENYYSDRYISLINQEKFDFIIVIDDHARYGNIKKFLNALSSPSIVISSIEHDSQATLVYPYWLIAYPNYYKIDTDKTISLSEKKYLFSFITIKYAGHKLANLVKLHQSSFWDQTLINFLLLNPGDNIETARLEHCVSGGLEYFKNHLEPILPLSLLGEYDNNPLAYNNPAFLDSYVNIVVEHTVEFCFITEKITKCLLAEQFFVVFGGVGIIKKLEEYGIDTYNDIIDHSRYDLCSSQSQRLEKIYELLEEIKTYNWLQIYKDTVQRRTKNRALILSGVLKEQFDTKLKSCLSSYKNK